MRLVGEQTPIGPDSAAQTAFAMLGQEIVSQVRPLLAKLAWSAFLLFSALLFFTALAHAQGFRPYVGQFDGSRDQPYDKDVLFALQGQRFYRNAVEIFPGITFSFMDSNTSVTVMGLNRLAYPVNIYSGPIANWRENVPQFSTVRYEKIYPGIDMEWKAAPDSKLRFILSPGADLKQIVFRSNLAVTVTPKRLPIPNYPGRFILSITELLDGLQLYQGVGKASLTTSLMQLDAYTFGLKDDSYDLSLPTLIEIGAALGPYNPPYRSFAINLEKDGSQFAYYLPSSMHENFLLVPGSLRKTLPDGTLTLLTEFNGLQGTWLGRDAQGRTSLAGYPGYFGTPPLTADAPQSSKSTGWFGQFDSSGKLLGSTNADYLEGPIAVGPDSSIYFATSASIIKWVPGERHFAFAVPMENVSALSANAASISFAIAKSPGRPTSATAIVRNYRGPCDLYTGKLNVSSGTLQWATYVPITGCPISPEDTPISQVFARLALAPTGELWISSEIIFDKGSPGAQGHTLLSISADGSRVMTWESIPFFPSMAFDTTGKLVIASFTSDPDLPTSADAGARIVCDRLTGTYIPYLYAAKRTTDGSIPYATYLYTSPGYAGPYPYSRGSIVSFDGDSIFTELIYSNNDFRRVIAVVPSVPEINCFINPASRRGVSSANYSGYQSAAGGELLTIVGRQLGPTREVHAALDVSGHLPLQLDGVQVLADGVALPLLSVQQSLITFYAPPELYRPNSAAATKIQVTASGIPIANDIIYPYGSAVFTAFSADNSGSGQSAALNQDGTFNSSNNPAPSGSIVSIFGNGQTLPAPIRLGNQTAEVLYFGQAPGLAPGVYQLNLRVPQASPTGSTKLSFSTTFIYVR